VATGQLLQTLTRKPQARYDWQVNTVSLAFSPDGTELAGGGEDGVIGIWEIRTGRHLTDLVGHSDTPYGLAFSPDKRTVVSSSGGGSDYSLRLWGVDNSAQITKIDLGGLGTRQRSATMGQKLRP